MACEEQETTYWAGITRLDKGSCPQPSSLQTGLALHMPDHSVCFPHPPMQCPTPGYFSAPIHNGHSIQHTVALGEYLLSGKTAKCLATMTKEVKAVGAEAIIQWLKHLGGQSSDTQKPNAGWVWWPAYHPWPWRQRRDPHHTLATSASCGFD